MISVRYECSGFKVQGPGIRAQGSGFRSRAHGHHSALLMTGVGAAAEAEDSHTCGFGESSSYAGRAESCTRACMTA